MSSINGITGTATEIDQSNSKRKAPSSVSDEQGTEAKVARVVTFAPSSSASSNSVDPIVTIKDDDPAVVV